MTPIVPCFLHTMRKHNYIFVPNLKIKWSNYSFWPVYTEHASRFICGFAHVLLISFWCYDREVPDWQLSKTIWSGITHSATSGNLCHVIYYRSYQKIKSYSITIVYVFWSEQLQVWHGSNWYPQKRPHNLSLLTNHGASYRQCFRGD